MSWNLYHGRDFPPDPTLRTLRSRLLRTSERNLAHVQVNRSLRWEFAGLLGRWDWDVALLQEVPPRWLPTLEHATRAEGVLALTSRNVVPALQDRLAEWNPDLLASWEGGSNQLLVRGRVVETRQLTLTRRPERRSMIWARVRVGEHELCVANLHASAGRPAAAVAELRLAAERAVEWAGELPLILGGDLNLRPVREPEPFAELRERFGLREPTAPDAIDHLLARGLQLVDEPRRLPPEAREVPGPGGLPIRLSDHAVVTATFGVA